VAKETLPPDAGPKRATLRASLAAQLHTRGFLPRVWRHRHPCRCPCGLGLLAPVLGGIQGGGKNPTGGGEFFIPWW